MNKEYKIYGTNGISVSKINDDEIVLSVCNDGIVSNMKDEIDFLAYEIETLKESEPSIDDCTTILKGLLEQYNKEINKRISRIETRINNIIAEKQILEYAEKIEKC